MYFFRLTVLIVLPLSLCFGQIKGKVIHISDGDTFTIQVNNEQFRIRLYGIDCPELNQEFGEEAKIHITVLFRLANDSVTITKKDVDQYGRIVGIALTKNTNVNESLLEKGLAWHYKRYDQNPKWIKLEKQARLLGLFIWSKPNSIPPWEWRRQKVDR